MHLPQSANFFLTKMPNNISINSSSSVVPLLIKEKSTSQRMSVKKKRVMFLPLMQPPAMSALFMPKASMHVDRLL